eukprot:scaffold243025_cov33-Tisochrysis_lutea.AAC.1
MFDLQFSVRGVEKKRCQGWHIEFNVVEMSVQALGINTSGGLRVRHIARGSVGIREAVSRMAYQTEGATRRRVVLVVGLSVLGWRGMSHVSSNGSPSDISSRILVGRVNVSDRTSVVT